MQIQVKKDKEFIKIDSSVDIEYIIYLFQNNKFSIVDSDNFDSTKGEPYYFEMSKNSIYKVVLINGIENEVDDGLGNITYTYEDYETFVGNFNELIKNLSKDFVNFLCDKCNEQVENCKPCDDNGENLNFLRKFNTLTSKYHYLNSFIRKLYKNEELKNIDNFIYLGVNTLSCKVTSQYERLIAEECLNGLSNNTELYKLLMTINYLSIYFVERYNVINNSEDVDNIYNIENVKECLCNTCFRFEELKEIFEQGVVEPTLPQISNKPPKGDDIFINIESNSNVYEKTLSQNLFSNSYVDDNTVNPVNIIIDSLPQNGSIIDTGGNSVSVGQSIPFVDLPSYKITFTTTISGTSTNFDNFKFKYNDGNSSSSTRKATITLISTKNFPPRVLGNISKDFSNSFANITKEELFSSLLVEDPEGDSISTIKLLNFNNNSVEVQYRNEQGDYIPMALNQEIDFKTYSAFSTIIKIKFLENRDNLNVVFDYKDDGSNEYGSSSSPQNVLNVNLTVKETSSIVFTAGFIADSSETVRLVGAGRFKYSGNASDISVELLDQTGSTINNDLSIAPANNSYYDFYNNSGNIISGSGGNTNIINNYDIILKTDFVNNREFSFKVTFNNKTSDLILNSNVSLLVTPDVIDVDFIIQKTGYFLDYVDYIENVLVEGDKKLTLPQNFNEVTSGKIYEVNSKVILEVTCQFSFKVKIDDYKRVKILNQFNIDVTVDSFYRSIDSVNGYVYYTSRNIFTSVSNLYYKFEFLPS